MFLSFAEPLASEREQTGRERSRASEASAANVHVQADPLVVELREQAERERAERRRERAESDVRYRESLSLVIERLDAAECRAEAAEARAAVVEDRLAQVLDALLDSQRRPWWGRIFGKSRRSDLEK